MHNIPPASNRCVSQNKLIFFEITEGIYVYMCMHIIEHCYLLMHALAGWSMIPLVFSEGIHGCELPNARRFPFESSTFGMGSSLAMS